MAAIVSRDVSHEKEISRDSDAFDESEGPPQARVDSFLDCVETQKQRSNRAGWTVLAVGALVAGVAYLTSIGVVGPDARAAAASAGTLVVGYVVGNK